MTKLAKILSIGLVALSLTACSLFSEKSFNQDDEVTTITSKLKADNEDMRLNFNKITVGKAVNDFQGGSSVEEVKALFGEPTKQEQQPAGSVNLDVYIWQKGRAELTVKFYNNSAIVRTISNFQFIREVKRSKKDYDKLEKDMSYSEVVALFGEPDVMSQAVSSSQEEIQAIWLTGIKGNNPQMQLFFVNNLMTEKSQKNMN